MTDPVLALLQNAAGHFQRGDYAAVLAASEEALRRAPGHPEALHVKALALGRMGRIDEALPLFDRAAAAHPQRHAILANKGNALRAAGRASDAAAAYEAALNAAPNFLDAWLNLGLAAREAGDEARAEEAFRRALEISPGNPKAQNNLGLLLLQQERSEEADAMFSQALAGQPGMVSALVNRGAARRNTGRIEEALADLRRGVELAPDNAEAWLQLGAALRQAGTLADADAAYRRALALAPARSDIHRDLANMRWEAGRKADFLQPLDAVIGRAPSAALLVLKSEIAYRVGMADIADAAAQRAAQLGASLSAPHRMIGQIRRHVGDDAASVQAFERALAADPDDFESIHAMAEMLLDIGAFERAVALLDREAPPDHLQKHIALKTNAMRLTGDMEYRRYYDYDRFTRKMIIDTPEGFSDLASFNAALIDALMPLHAAKAQPIDQTLYGGTQSVGRLWDEPHPVIQALKRALLKAAAEFVDSLPDDPSHPFLARKSRHLKCMGAWSVMLTDGGGHVDHIHPNGWISAPYYVRVPDEVKISEKQGFLRLGACPARDRPLPAERWIKPEEGAVIFFPSYMWHGVEPFSAPTARITAPFDLAPA